MTQHMAVATVERSIPGPGDVREVVKQLVEAEKALACGAYSDWDLVILQARVDAARQTFNEILRHLPHSVEQYRWWLEP